MGDDDRVVLRSGWLVDALSSAPVPLIFWFGIFRHGGLPGAAFVVVMFVGITIAGHHRTRVVLTAEGVELWRGGRTAVPWSYVGGFVFTGSRSLQRSVAVVLPDRSVKPLPAPRSLFGIGRYDVEYASRVIEQRWVRHRAVLASTTAPPS
jgi:hypothetical protein